MKTVAIVIVLIVAAAAGVWRFYPELVRPLVEQTPLKGALSTSTPVYQWRDAQGNWQVTDQPPPEGTPYQIKQYSLDANILPPFPAAGEGD